MQLVLGNTAKEFVGEADEDPCSVTCVLFATTGATVIHIAQNRIRVCDDLMARYAFYVRDKSDPA